MLDLPELIVTRPEELPDCCDHIAAAAEVGFDTEFVGEDSYIPHLCLLQIATDSRIYLIDPLTVGPLDRFWQVLTDPARLVVVHAGREEVRLCKHFTSRDPNAFDLQIAAGLVGLTYPISYGNLLADLVHVRLEKRETLTEWRKRPLTPEQIHYAFDDVRYLLAAWRTLKARLDERGRGDWAKEEFARLAASLGPVEGESEKWRKLPGLGQLDRKRLAVVRELFFWREELAARMNRPPRVLVRDDLLVEIARRNPTKETDLHVVRGLAHRFAGGILQAVERGKGLPVDQHPRMPRREVDPLQLGLIANLLTAVVGDFAARHHIAPNLVATSNELKLLVRCRWRGVPLPQESLLGQGWRAEHVLPELRALLEGRKWLRVDDVHRDSPFSYREEARSHKPEAPPTSADPPSRQST